MAFRVLTCEFVHETNTFSVRKVCIEDFRRETLMDHDEALARRATGNTPLAGTLDCARRYGWEVFNAVSAWNFSAAGCVTEAAYEEIVGRIVGAARENRYDGMLLNLHGAMVAEHVEDCEGELVARLRAVVGPNLPIAVTLDPHANVFRRLCDLAQIVVSMKTYPHVDMAETAILAGDILQRTMAGEIAPRTLRVWRPMLEEANGGRTDARPMVARIARAREWEATAPGALAVSVNGAFPEADISEVGPTVLVTHTGDPAPHLALANEIADDIWNRRHEVLNTFHSAEEAARIAAAHPAGGKPIVVADYADNPGGGAYGDATSLLQALLAAKVENACFGPIADGEAAGILHAAGEGAEVTLDLGGKTDPRFGGGPLRVRGRVLHVSDGRFVGDGPMVGGLEQSLGPTAVLRVDDIDILVTTLPLQMLDLQMFRAFGIDPAQKRVVGLKSMQHFRAAFEPIAERVIVCDSGALCTLDYARLPFTRVARPIFPLDGDFDWKGAAE